MVKADVLELIQNTDFSKEFVIDIQNKKQYNYSDFFRKCILLAEFIENYSKYKNVIVIMENCVDLLELYFAIMLTDCQIWVIDPQKAKGEIEEIIADISEAILITDRKEISEGHHKNISALFEKCHLSGTGLNVKDLVLKRLKKRDFSEKYLVTFTSGTSGKAKGVSHSLCSLFQSAYALQEKVMVEAGATFLHVMPMTYMAGILNSFFFPFIARLRIIVWERFSVKVAFKFWECVSKYNATVFWLSPIMLLMINQLDRKEIGQEFCKNHEMFFLIGTAALTDNIKKGFEQRYGVPLFASYGLSETLFISIETKKSKMLCKEKNVGEMLNHVKAKVCADGELLLDVPWMFLGYTNVSDIIFFEKDYYKTGDLGEINGNILKITGRKKDLIIKGGINISPINIEDVINKMEEIEECVILGMENKYGEEIIGCAYSIKVATGCADNKTLEIKMNKEIDKELGKIYHIDKFVYCKKIPRNVNGKIDKQMLRDMVGMMNDSEN